MKIKAQALATYNDAAVLWQIMEALPEFAREVCTPLANTSQIVINSSSPSANSDLATGINNFLAQAPASIKALSGIDLVRFLNSKMTDTPSTVSA